MGSVRLRFCHCCLLSVFTLARSGLVSLLAQTKSLRVFFFFFLFFSLLYRCGLSPCPGSFVDSLSFPSFFEKITSVLVLTRCALFSPLPPFFYPPSHSSLSPFLSCKHTGYSFDPRSFSVISSVPSDTFRCPHPFYIQTILRSKFRLVCIRAKAPLFGIVLPPFSPFQSSRCKPFFRERTSPHIRACSGRRTHHSLCTQFLSTSPLGSGILTSYLASFFQGISDPALCLVWGSFLSPIAPCSRQRRVCYLKDSILILPFFPPNLTHHIIL